MLELLSKPEALLLKLSILDNHFIEVNDQSTKT